MEWSQVESEILFAICHKHRCFSGADIATAGSSIMYLQAQLVLALVTSLLVTQQSNKAKTETSAVLLIPGSFRHEKGSVQQMRAYPTSTWAVRCSPRLPTPAKCVLFCMHPVSTWHHCVEPVARRIGSLDTSKFHGEESQAVFAAASSITRHRRTVTVRGKYFSPDNLLV